MLQYLIKSHQNIGHIVEKLLQETYCGSYLYANYMSCMHFDNLCHGLYLIKHTRVLVEILLQEQVLKYAISYTSL